MTTRRDFMRHMGAGLASFGLGSLAGGLEAWLPDAQAAGTTGERIITVLHTNDVHSRIDPFPEDGSGDGGGHHEHDNQQVGELLGQDSPRADAATLHELIGTVARPPLGGLGRIETGTGRDAEVPCHCFSFACVPGPCHAFSQAPRIPRTSSRSPTAAAWSRMSGSVRTGSPAPAPVPWRVPQLPTRWQIVVNYDLLTDDDDERDCEDIPEAACEVVPANLFLQGGTRIVTRPGDEVANAKTVLALDAGIPRRIQRLDQLARSRSRIDVDVAPTGDR